MPVIETPATVGDIDGLCISADTELVNDAADFLAYAVSDAALEIVTRTGYIVPANTEVAGSEAFLWPGREPEHATVFNSAIRGMVIPPLLDHRPELEAAVAPLLDDLVTSPGVLDLEAATEEIDNASRTVLDPESVTESPRRSPVGVPDRVVLSIVRDERTLRSADRGPFVTEYRRRPGRPRSSATGRRLDVAGEHGAGEGAGDQRQLPRAGAVAGELGAQRVGQLGRLAGLGRRPHGAPHEVGGQEVLHRQVVLLGEREHRRARRLEAAVGDDVAVGPHARVRRPVDARVAASAARPRAARARRPGP